MKIVNDCGSLYRMTDRRYRKFLSDGEAGMEPNAREYGKLVGSVAFSTLDARPSDYAMQYEIDFPRGGRP